MEIHAVKIYVGTFHAAICLMSEAYVYYTRCRTEKQEEESGSSLWLLWVFLLGIIGAVVAILLIQKNSKQGKYAK